MSYSIISKLISFEARTAGGEKFVATFGLLADSNVWSYDNKSRPKSWSLLMGTYSQEEQDDMAALHAPDIDSGGLKLHGLSGRGGEFDLAISGFVRLANKYKKPDVELDHVVPEKSAWAQEAYDAFRSAIRPHLRGSDPMYDDFEWHKKVIERSAEGYGATMRELHKEWRDAKIEDFFTKRWADSLNHLRVHGSGELLGELFRYKGTPEAESESAISRDAALWHAERLIERAYCADDVERLLRTLPETFGRPDDEVFDALLEAKAASHRTNVETAEKIMAMRQNRVALCERFARERDEAQKKAQEEAKANGGAKVIEFASFAENKSWYTNTGRLIEPRLEHFAKFVENTEIVLTSEEEQRLQNILYVLERRAYDHERGRHRGHKKAARVLKAAVALLAPLCAHECAA